MGIIKSNHKIASVVHHSYQLLPVLNRFGIRLGVKEKTIGQICNEKGLNTHFVLAIINAYHSVNYFPEQELKSIPVDIIVQYLRKTHQYYVGYVLKNIDALLEQLIKSGGNNDGLRIIKTFYNRYKEELTNHINDEEQNVFPYVLKLEEAINSNNASNTNYSNFSITQFEKEHSNVDDKLNDLKNIIIKFLEPTYDDNACNAFLSAVYQFEKDLTDHSRIEDLILVPKVIEMENSLQNG